MSKKRSLADDLAEMLLPAPAQEFDPEDDLFEAGPALIESDEELDGNLQGARRAREKAMRLRGDIDLQDERYRGQHTTRRAAFGSGADDTGSDGTGGDESDAGASEPDSLVRSAGALDGLSGATPSSSEEGDDGLDGSRDQVGEQLGAGSGAVLANGNGLHVSSDEDASQESGGDGRDAGDGSYDAASAEDGGELAALEREYEELQVAEAEAAAGLRVRAAKERQKALAVQAQQQLWQRGLEMRILLQKVLQGSNRLPLGPMRDTAASCSPELQEAYAGVVKEAEGLTEDLCQLMDALHHQNGAVAEAATEAQVGQKRSSGPDQQATLQQLWSGLDTMYSGFSAFRDASIDRWHRKTTLTTGGAVRSSLKALNQSVSAQVAAMMRDPHKLVQRTQAPKLRSRRLCEVGGQDDERRDTSEHMERDVYDGDDERDEETFEDTEFYQTLLKEFLEGSNAAGGGNWFMGPKHRKVVDRRASKGRKVRYHVHEKLVNFMIPVDLEQPHYAANVFSNLFGGSVHY